MSDHPRRGSKLLIDEPPLIVLPSLAAAIGLSEAILLQQIHYWLRQGGHVRDGRRWIYNSYPQWAAQLPFWKEGAIRRILEHLRARGLLLTGNYNASPLDRTIWYTIDYDALAALALGPSAGCAPSSGVIARWPGESGGPSAVGSPPFGESARPIPETTTETTSETIPERESAPPLPGFESFHVTDAHAAWFATAAEDAGVPRAHINLPAETDKWRDAIRAGHRAVPTDPTADWRQWMRRAISYTLTHPNPAGGPTHGTLEQRARRTAADDAAADAAAAELIAALDALAGPGRLPGDHPGPDPLPALQR